MTIPLLPNATAGESHGHGGIDIADTMPGRQQPRHPAGRHCGIFGAKQRDDLERQVRDTPEKFPEAGIVRDIGSGPNFRRKGMLAILERALSGTVVTLVVAHKDRLARFGFQLVQWLLERNGGKVVVLNDVSQSPEHELTRDLLTIIHVFSCRLHGLRKYRAKIQSEIAQDQEGSVLSNG